MDSESCFSASFLVFDFVLLILHKISISFVDFVRKFPLLFYFNILFLTIFQFLLDLVLCDPSPSLLFAIFKQKEAFISCLKEGWRWY